MTVENFAFRDYHAIEMPDAYEMEFLKSWSEENTEENFNFIVKYTLTRQWFQKLHTFEVRKTTLQQQVAADLQRV